MTEIAHHDLGRNDPCYCGSGKKYKKCHLREDEAAEREARESAAADDAIEVPAGETEQAETEPKQTDQPWKRSVQTHKPYPREE